jgi:hypothetical protein
MSEIEDMAMLIAGQKKEINDWKEKYSRLKNENDKLVRTNNSQWEEIKELKKKIEQPYNADSFKALMDAHEIIKRENAEMHKRCDAAFAGVAMDASSKKHYLQAIIERLDGIKNSVEVALDDGGKTKK